MNVNELCGIDDVQCVGELIVGFAGKPDDDVRRDRGSAEGGVTRSIIRRKSSRVYWRFMRCSR
jgi:hypothetical protein